MTTDQTDHRTIADRLLFLAKDGATPTEHLLAALHDGQAEQTEWLHRIRDLLAVMAEPTGDPCPCGCRLNVDPPTFIAAHASWDRKWHEGELLTPDEVAERPEPDRWGTHDRIGSRCTRVGCLELHDPEPESVTVTLPRTQFMDASTVRRLAEAHLDPGHCHAVTAGIMTALADALDAASATQEADQGERVAQGAGDAEHDCETCQECLHNGARCCGCYDGACCIEREGQADE